MLVCHFVINNLKNPVAGTGFLNNDSKQSKFEESKSPRSSVKVAFLADVDGGGGGGVSENKRNQLIKELRRYDMRGSKASGH